MKSLKAKKKNTTIASFKNRIEKRKRREFEKAKEEKRKTWRGKTRAKKLRRVLIKCSMKHGKDEN